MPRIEIVERFEDSFGGDHARFHRGVRALDFGDVQKASCATHHATAWEGQFWYRLKTAFVQGAGTIGNAAAAFEYIAHRRMCFETLKFFEW